MRQKLGSPRGKPEPVGGQIEEAGMKHIEIMEHEE
jgi:hypothetical protein